MLRSPEQTTPSSVTGEVFGVIVLPFRSWMKRLMRCRTWNTPPQYGGISRSNHIPRLRPSGVRVAAISSLDFTRTHSPGWRSSRGKVASFFAVPGRWISGTIPSLRNGSVTAAREVTFRKCPSETLPESHSFTYGRGSQTLRSSVHFGSSVF